MKAFKSLCVLLCALFLQAWTQTASAQTSASETDDTLIPIDEAHFPDSYFRSFVKSYDDNGDDMLSKEEREISSMVIGPEGSGSITKINNLNGIQYFSTLNALRCTPRIEIEYLDLSDGPNLTTLDCESNNLSSLELSGCSNLTSLTINGNDLTSLDLSNCPYLQWLNVSYNNLTSLDLSHCTQIDRLQCDHNQLSSLILSNSMIEELYCQNNNLTTLDLSGCRLLDRLCCQNNNLISLDLSGCSNLTYLRVHDNNLTSLDLSHCSNLSELYCSDNQLSSLDLSGSLRKLNCSDNQLSSLDLSDFSSLSELYCSDNQLSSLDLSNCSRLEDLYCDSNQLFLLDLSGCSNLTRLYCDSNNLTSLDLSDCSNLTRLYCNFNNLTSLDLSQCSLLEYLDCSSNKLSYLLLDNLSKLEDLYCNNNQLTCLDLYSDWINLHWQPNLPFFVTLNKNNGFNTSTLPGFDAQRVFDLQGGIFYDSILRFTQKEITYKYRTVGHHGEPIECTLWTDTLYEIAIDEQNFPDTSFRNYIAQHIDNSQNGYLSMDEIYRIRKLDISNQNIKNLQGIEFLEALNTLDCSDNQLSSLDLSCLSNIGTLLCSNNPLACLNLNARTNLLCDTNLPFFATLNKNNGFNTSTLPGFDAQRVFDLQGGIFYDSILRFTQKEITYKYRTGGQGEPIECTLWTDTLYEIAIDEQNFPDMSFRNHIAQHVDSSQNGYLSRSEILNTTNLDISSQNIQNLQGIELFPELSNLDCSDNQLSSLDLSHNSDLTQLDCSDNQLSVTLDENNCIDIAILPGFDPDRASDWEGGHIEDSRLQFLQAEVSYAYETGYQGEAELPEVRFLLDAGNGEKEIAVSETNFPDAVFRSHVSEQIDRSGNDSLDIVERGNVHTLDVSGLGIQDLRGIEYFSQLENLDCSDNKLTSLDLSKNPALQVLNAEDNQLDITLDANDGFDLSTLPGFDVSKASDWEGGTYLDSILTFNQQEVTYAYATGYNGSTEDESLQSVRFSLMADRDPSVANESIKAGQGRVYAKDHVIHTEGIESEISVFTPSGILLYQGHDKEIPIRNDGVYIVRSGQQVWKVLVI